VFIGGPLNTSRQQDNPSYELTTSSTSPTTFVLLQKEVTYPPSNISTLSDITETLHENLTTAFPFDSSTILPSHAMINESTQFLESQPSGLSLSTDSHDFQTPKTFLTLNETMTNPVSAFVIIEESPPSTSYESNLTSASSTEIPILYLRPTIIAHNVPNVTSDSLTVLQNESTEANAKNSADVFMNLPPSSRSPTDFNLLTNFTRGPVSSTNNPLTTLLIASTENITKLFPPYVTPPLSENSPTSPLPSLTPFFTPVVSSPSTPKSRQINMAMQNAPVNSWDSDEDDGAVEIKSRKTHFFWRVFTIGGILLIFV